MTFDSFVYNVNADVPPMIGPSLTAADGSVALLTINGTYSGKIVDGILYNAIAGAGTATATLSVATVTAPGLSAKVSPVYNGSTFALYLEDHSTVLFTVVTGAGTTVQTTATGAPVFTHRGPNERRRFAVEF
jgi:hypothetical protein